MMILKMCPCLFAQFYFRTSVSTNKCNGRGSAKSVEWGGDGAERWTSESSSNDKHLSVISVKVQSWREETAYKWAVLYISVWERDWERVHVSWEKVTSESCIQRKEWVYKLYPAMLFSAGRGLLHLYPVSCVQWKE